MSRYIEPEDLGQYSVVSASIGDYIVAFVGLAVMFLLVKLWADYEERTKREKREREMLNGQVNRLTWELEQAHKEIKRLRTPR